MGAAKVTAVQGVAKGERIALPPLGGNGGVSVEQALRLRRSIREFSPGALSLAEASQLLWATQGITGSRGFRTAPSAGALYPLVAYLVAGAVDGLPDGVYRYEPSDHALFAVAEGDRRRALSAAAWAQGWIQSGAAAIVLAAVFERTTGKYGERGRRYVYIETGHAAQNVCLQGAALGLGVTPVGAFNDDHLKTVVEMGRDERPLYILPLGRRA